jgi:hypothetical protein
MATGAGRRLGQRQFEVRFPAKKHFSSLVAVSVKNGEQLLGKQSTLCIVL